MRYLVALLLVFAAPVASANQIPHAMQTGGRTSQPIGHYEFCKRTVGECTKIRDDGPLHLTKALWKKISEANVTLNGKIRPMSDHDIYGEDEVWVYPLDVGDCEDYVLAKRLDLFLHAGIPLSDLLITVVRKPDGEGHAVLTVRTDRGDYILDNLNDTVKPFEKTGYTYLKRQATNHTGRWVTIRSQNDALVGSIE